MSNKYYAEIDKTSILTWQKEIHIIYLKSRHLIKNYCVTLFLTALAILRFFPEVLSFPINKQENVLNILTIGVFLRRFSQNVNKTAI